MELYERVLEAGINVVTTADWVTGHHRDTNHRRGAGESEVLGGLLARESTFYGTGMNPGLAQILTIVHSTDVADIENVTCIESVDVSCHHSAETWANCGFGRPVYDPEVPRLLELGTRVFEDGVRLMADCLDIELDEVASTNSVRAQRMSTSAGTTCRPGRWAVARSVCRLTASPASSSTWSGRSRRTTTRTGTFRAATSPRSRATRASTAST